MKVIRKTGVVVGMCLSMAAATPGNTERPTRYNWEKRPAYGYVVSSSEGDFYARGTPPARAEEKGKTEVFRVATEGADKRLATYDWYLRPEEVQVCGNPASNNVALIVHTPWFGRGDWKQTADQTVFEFLGQGRRLATYSVDDLVAMGVSVGRMAAELDIYQANYRVEGCERVGEKEYAFTVVGFGGKRIRFNILTGGPLDKDP